MTEQFFAKQLYKLSLRGSKQQKREVEDSFGDGSLRNFQGRVVRSQAIGKARVQSSWRNNQRLP